MANPTNEQAVQSQKRRFHLHRTLRFWLIILAIVVVIGLIIQFTRSSTNQNSHIRPSVPVVLGKAVQKNVPIYYNGLGSVIPTASVTVRTQINGILFKVYFHEGQMVKVGDVLAQIDPRPYQAQLIQYQGQLQRDGALLANAQVDLKRYQTLWKQDSVSEQTLATQRALVQQYQGTVLTDQGLVQATQVNLTYCNIIAPVDGRIGLRLIDPGNYVQTSDTNGIAVVTTLDPITIVFSLPEDNIPTVLAQMNQGHNLSVYAYNRDQTNLLATGTLITIDNEIDPTTGTVRLRAMFNNPHYQLFPNQFVNVHLLVNTLVNAITVPTAAIQYGANGRFVYVFDPVTQKVKVTPVTVTVTAGGDTVVTNGITVNQLVVTQGSDNLTDGAKVKVAQPLTAVVAAAAANNSHANAHRRRQAS